jgi:hypothetical protein
MPSVLATVLALSGRAGRFLLLVVIQSFPACDGPVEAPQLVLACHLAKQRALSYGNNQMLMLTADRIRGREACLLSRAKLTSTRGGSLLHRS